MRNEIISSHQLLRGKTKTTLLHRCKANSFTLFHGVAVKHYWLTFAVGFLQLNLNDRYKDVCLTISLDIAVTLQKNNHIVNASSVTGRARNNGRSTDNVRTDCGFDQSNFRLAGHVARSKFSRIENEINLRFLLFSCFSCYLSSRCVLRNFDMKSW